MKFFWISCALCLALVFGARAQGQEGMQWGNVVLRPEASVLGAYDNRVILPPVGNAEGDFYSDVAAGVQLNNLPARYDLSAAASYGYRFHSQYTELDDDFYNLGAAVGSGQNPFKWGLSSDLTKSLSYNTNYDPASGQQPDSILTDSPNRRSVTQGNISYDKSLTDKLTLRPEYRLLHYFQEFQGSETAEWQIHQANIQLRHKHSEKTTFTAGGYYSLQANEDEDGYIGTIMIGAEGQATEKTSWLAELGFAQADYELSGTDQGFVSSLRGMWQATEKVSAYVFGGNDFQPGYGGGAARWVYRLGYGARWQMVEKMGLQASMLHDYQDEIGNNTSTDPAIGIVRHFFNTSASYQFTERFVLVLGYRYTRDEESPDQQVVSLRLGYAY